MQIPVVDESETSNDENDELKTTNDEGDELETSDDEGKRFSFTGFGIKMVGTYILEWINEVKYLLIIGLVGMFFGWFFTYISFVCNKTSRPVPNIPALTTNA